MRQVKRLQPAPKLLAGSGTIEGTQPEGSLLAHVAVYEYVYVYINIHVCLCIPGFMFICIQKKNVSTWYMCMFLYVYA